MSEVQETAAQPAIVQAVLRLPPAEQQRLLGWSRGLGEIRYGTLRGFKKAGAMLALTRDRKAAWPLLKSLDSTSPGRNVSRGSENSNRNCRSRTSSSQFSCHEKIPDPHAFANRQYRMLCQHAHEPGRRSPWAGVGDRVSWM